MLDGLDDVPWSTLKHAYGKANDVPDQLRALLSPDPPTRANARYWLGAPAVPVLLEHACDPKVYFRRVFAAALKMIDHPSAKAALQTLENDKPVGRVRGRRKDA